MTRKNKLLNSPNLPIFMSKRKILEKIKTHQVVIITGKTGCGKSTQVPKYLYENGYSNNGIIACLHPRCVAAMSLAERVSYELNKELGSLIGYQVRFHKQISFETKIIFMTTGYMLMMMREPELISKYSVVIIDEAHERSVQTDLMMGLMKDILKSNKLVKLIIMSATLDVDQIKDFYENCAVVPIDNVPDKMEVIYRPPPSENYIANIKIVVNEILTKYKKGHILIFLQSEEKVLKCMKQLRNLNSTKLLPFFASMDEEEKQRVFENHGNRRKIIIATNVAETSLTIPGVDFVVDSGLVKRVQFDHKTGVEKWMTKFISVAEADQRKGRTGRTGKGFCYRLYDEKCIKSDQIDLLDEIRDLTLQNGDINLEQSNNNQLFSKNGPKKFPKFPDPEIKTVNLNSMTLILKSMNWDDVMKFPFIVVPEIDKIENALKELEDLSLLNEQKELTKIGKMASSLSLEPRLGKVATIAAELPCRTDVLKIIAMLSVRNVLKSPSKSQSIHKRFIDEHGDLFQLLNIFNEASVYRFAGWWCAENQIDKSCLKYAHKVFSQLEWYLSDKSNSSSNKSGFYNTFNENMIKKAFLSGFFKNIARKHDETKYRSDDDKVLTVHKTSCLDKTEEIVFYQTIQKPSESDEIVIRYCTPLNKQMLIDLTPQKFKIKALLWKSIKANLLES